jgi:hypothetical protein
MGFLLPPDSNKAPALEPFENITYMNTDIVTTDLRFLCVHLFKMKEKWDTDCSKTLL